MISKINGFSLLEVLISIAVLSIGILGLVKMQTFMEVKAENALISIDALYLSESTLESYLARINDVSGSVGLISFAEIKESSASLGSFTIETEVASSSISSISNALKIVTVTTSWLDRHGQSQAVELKTAISRYSEFD